MKHRLAIALAAICAACAPPVDFVTYHGLRVRVGETQQTQTEIEAATEAVVLALGDKWYGGTKQTRDWLWGLLVWVDNGPVNCPGMGKDDHCYGLASEYGVRYQYFRCIAHSAFQHELIHFLLLKKSNWPDYEHLSADLWALGGVESDARMAACFDTCPEVCR